MISRFANWSTFEFTPGYADCSIAFTTSENRIIHYCVVFGLIFVLIFVLSFLFGVFSYYKVFLKTRQDELDVVPSYKTLSVAERVESQGKR